MSRQGYAKTIASGRALADEADPCSDEAERLRDSMKVNPAIYQNEAHKSASESLERAKAADSLTHTERADLALRYLQIKATRKVHSDFLAYLGRAAINLREAK